VDEENLEEAITRLSRVGFDQVIGYLSGGFETWKNSGKEIDQVKSISSKEFEAIYKANNTVSIIDVRKNSEFLSERIQNAVNIPLSKINEHLDTVSEDGTNYIHCAGGYRSMIASSILKSRGVHNLVNIKGGFKELKEMDLPMTDYVCPSTL
jgi:rhodanese-related sulfurtransferase